MDEAYNGGGCLLITGMLFRAFDYIYVETFLYTYIFKLLLLTLCNCKSFMLYLMSAKHAPGLTHLANTWGKLTYISTNALVKIAAPSKTIIFPVAEHFNLRGHKDGKTNWCNFKNERLEIFLTPNEELLLFILA